MLLSEHSPVAWNEVAGWVLEVKLRCAVLYLYVGDTVSRPPTSSFTERLYVLSIVTLRA